MRIRFEDYREKEAFIEALIKDDRETLRAMYNRALKTIAWEPYEDWENLDNAYVKAGGQNGNA